MRDILLTLIVLGMVPLALRSPRIGVLAYVWLSVMNPHKLVWGFAQEIRWQLMVGIATLVGLLLSKDQIKWPPKSDLYVLLIVFFVWTGVTTALAVHFEDSFETWQRFVKTQIMVLMIPALFHTREHLRQLTWVVVLSVAYYGVKGGVFVLLTGGGDRVWGPEGTYIEDNNSLAVAVLMLIPIMRFLQLSEPSRYVRWACIGMMLLCTVAVIGSYSRGAFVAIAAMGILFWWKGRNKLIILIAGAALIPALMNFMPQQWTSRMDTISTFEEDKSANARLNSWETMFNIALDMPIAGAGFEVATQELYNKYSPNPNAPPQVAHSIYFQVLGGSGFVGLALYLALYFVYWRQAAALIRETRNRQDLEWVQNFARMSQVAMFGFLIGGAFLNLANYDVPYYLIAIMLATKALVDRELKTAQAGKMPAGISPGIGIHSERPSAGELPRRRT